MYMNINTIECYLENDIVPDCFNYTLTKQPNRDCSKVQYNDYYIFF